MYSQAKNHKSNTDSSIDVQVQFDYSTLDCLIAISRGSGSQEYHMNNLHKKMVCAPNVLQRYGLIRQGHSGMELTDKGQDVMTEISSGYGSDTEKNNHIKKLQCLALTAKKDQKIRTLLNEKLFAQATILADEGLIYRINSDENAFSKHIYYHTLGEKGDEMLKMLKGIYSLNHNMRKHEEADKETEIILDMFSKNNGTPESVFVTIEDIFKNEELSPDTVLKMEKNTFLRINSLVDSRGGLLPECYFTCTPKGIRKYNGINKNNNLVIRCLEMGIKNMESPKYTFFHFANKEILYEALIMEKAGYLKRNTINDKIPPITEFRYRISKEGKKSIDSAIESLNNQLGTDIKL